MGLFEHWPYTNFHDLNLDWIIKKLPEVFTASAQAVESAETAVNAKNTAVESAETAVSSAEIASTSAESAQDYAEHIADPVGGLVTTWLDENIGPTTPPVDRSLTIQDAAADAKATGDAIDSVIAMLSDAVPYNVRLAIDTLVQNMAVIDDDGYASEKAIIHAWASSTNVSYITAVYTQSGPVYDNDDIESLRSDLVVTAHYTDGTSAEVNAYALSGTLTPGSSAITVSYGGQTTTFTVTVTADLIYSLVNHVCDGTDSTIVNTGVTPFIADNDITILIDIETSAAQTTNWRILGDTAAVDGHQSGITIGKVTSTDNTNLRWMDSYQAVTNFTTNTVGRARFAVRHTANSGNAKFDYKVRNTAAAQTIVSSAFYTSSAPLIVGGNETGIRFFNGVISCYVYHKVKSDAEISTFLTTGEV